MEAQRLNSNIRQTIDKYVEYDCLSRNKREKKRDRLDVVQRIKDLCELEGIHSQEYVKYYYEELGKVDRGTKK